MPVGQCFIYWHEEEDAQAVMPDSLLLLTFLFFFSVGSKRAE